MPDQEKKTPRREAAALRYDTAHDTAPRMVAKGKGELAERILVLAREHGIPIHEDPDLVRVLGALDLYDEIPPELYSVIAEILAYVYRMNGRY